MNLPLQGFHVIHRLDMLFRTNPVHCSVLPHRPFPSSSSTKDRPSLTDTHTNIIHTAKVKATRTPLPPTAPRKLRRHTALTSRWYGDTSAHRAPVATFALHHPPRPAPEPPSRSGRRGHHTHTRRSSERDSQTGAATNHASPRHRDQS